MAAQGLGKAAQPLVESLTAAMPVVTDFAGTLIAAMDPLIRGLGEVAGYAVELLSAFNALNPSIKQFGIYAVVVGTAAVAGISAIGVALLSLVPAVASVATAFLTLDAAAAPFLLLAAGIGASAVVAFAPWVAWFTVLTTAAGALYAAWSTDFLGIASVVSGLAGILYDLASTAIGAVYHAFLSLDPAIGGVIGQVSEFASGVVKAGEIIYDALSHAFSVDGILGALTAVKTAMIDTAMSILSSLNATISGALPLLTKLGAGGSATATQGAILGSMLQLGSMSGAVTLPPEVEDSLKAATTATDDYRGALAGLLDGLDGATKKGHGASEAAKAHARAMKEEQKAAKDAADSLRDYVALYEEAASAVYAKKANPAADFQKQFESNISAFMPKFELSVSGKLDMAEADLAVALSRGVIDQEKYNADLKEVSIARLKIEQDYNDAQKAATAKMVAGIADQALGIVKGMGKFGDLVSAAQEGAKAGGAGGAAVAVVGQLLAWNEKFQKIIAKLDTVIEGVVTALDGLVTGLAPLLDVVGQIVTVVVGALAPVFTAIGNVFRMLAPIIGVVASLLTNLSGAFSIIAGVLTALSPILYTAFSVIDTVLRGVAIIILSVMYGIEVAWNAILEAVASLLQAVGANKAAKDLRNQKADAQGTLDQINDLISTSYEDAIKGTGGSSFHASVADSANATAAALDTLTQSLSNVPTGFKLEKYIYDAAAGQAGPTSYTGGASGSSGGNVTISIGSVVTAAADGATLAKQLQSYAQKQSVIKRYSTSVTVSKWGTA